MLKFHMIISNMIDFRQFMVVRYRDSIRARIGSIQNLGERSQELHYEHAQDFSLKSSILVEFLFHNMPFDG